MLEQKYTGSIRTLGTVRQPPEDFPIRGLIWAQPYVPKDSILDQTVNEYERTVDLPYLSAPRAGWCLWPGTNMAPVFMNFRKMRLMLREQLGKLLQLWPFDVT
jgi:hypothetical protein